MKGAGVGNYDVTEAHCPTGRTALDQALRLVIENYASNYAGAALGQVNTG